MRTNSDLCHLQHNLIDFYNRDEKCLLRGTRWVFKYGSLRFVFERVNIFLNIFFILIFYFNTFTVYLVLVFIITNKRTIIKVYKI